MRSFLSTVGHYREDFIRLGVSVLPRVDTSELAPRRPLFELQTLKHSKKQLCDRTLMLPGSTTTHENRIYKATPKGALVL
jgi:hypothetical protein